MSLPLVQLMHMKATWTVLNGPNKVQLFHNMLHARDLISPEPLSFTLQAVLDGEETPSYTGDVQVHVIGLHHFSINGTAFSVEAAFTTGGYGLNIKDYYAEGEQTGTGTGVVLYD